MASSIEYRRYMDECLRAAAKARSDEERRSLLQLAQTWHEAINLEASAALVKQNVTVSVRHTEQVQEGRHIEPEGLRGLQVDHQRAPGASWASLAETASVPR